MCWAYYLNEKNWVSMRIFEARLVREPIGSGGEWDEVLFTEQIKCCECKQWFDSDKVKWSNTVGGFHCDKCFAILKQEYHNHPDYDGDKFE